MSDKPDAGKVTEAQRERAAVVAWLREGNESSFEKLTLRHRIYVAWMTLIRPGEVMQAMLLVYANAIERGDHIEYSGYAEVKGGGE